MRVAFQLRLPCHVEVLNSHCRCSISSEHRSASPSHRWFTIFCDGLLNIDHMPFQGNVGVCLFPRYWIKKPHPHSPTGSLHWDTAAPDVMDKDWAATSCTYVLVKAIVSPFSPRRMQYPGAQGAPIWAHQATPWVSVLKVRPKVVRAWRYNLCFLNYAPLWRH